MVATREFAARLTQKQLIAERGGCCLMTVKDNQKELLDSLASGLDRVAAPVAATEYKTTEKGQGRIERERYVVRTGRSSTETVYGITSLGPEPASANALLRLNRGH